MSSRPTDRQTLKATASALRAVGDCCLSVDLPLWSASPPTSADMAHGRTTQVLEILEDPKLRQRKSNAPLLAQRIPADPNHPFFYLKAAQRNFSRRKISQKRRRRGSARRIAAIRYQSAYETDPPAGRHVCIDLDRITCARRIDRHTEARCTRQRGRGREKSRTPNRGQRQRGRPGHARLVGRAPAGRIQTGDANRRRPDRQG